MGGYLANFIVYTTAMIGIIFVALFVYKKTAVNSNSISKNKFLKIEDVISIAPRKQLIVIKAGNERFLVASDSERTNLISKLETPGAITKIQETPESYEPKIPTSSYTKSAMKRLGINTED